jgi:hypothetical protein
MAMTERTEDRAEWVHAIPPALPSVFEPDDEAGEAVSAMRAGWPSNTGATTTSRPPTGIG